MEKPPPATADRADARRRVPSTDLLLRDPRLLGAAELLGRALVKGYVRGAQQRVRAGELTADGLVDVVLAGLPSAPVTLTPVVNATGVILHTNLGRAALSAAAIEALGLAAGMSDIELDLSTGRRGARGRGALAALRSAVPDAEDVHLVNNGAAALALAATALGSGGRNIVIARGEMVEIGDGFRLPELLESTGAVLREVGATNRVRVDDYARAVDENTAFILKVHPSNFVITGFTSTVTVGELSMLGHPVVVDIGSGLLTPHPVLPDEPDMATMLRAGADLIIASGDKLLGGPQAGIIAGRAELVHRLRRHPLARALRVDKLTLAALEATLRGPQSPTAAALCAEPTGLLLRAERLAARLRDDGLDATSLSTMSTVGGGGAPGVELASAAISLSPAQAEPLRAGSPAVLGRVTDGRCVLDLRAVPPEADEQLFQLIRAAAGRWPRGDD